MDSFLHCCLLSILEGKSLLSLCASIVNHVLIYQFGALVDRHDFLKWNAWWDKSVSYSFGYIEFMDTCNLMTA